MSIDSEPVADSQTDDAGVLRDFCRMQVDTYGRAINNNWRAFWGFLIAGVTVALIAIAWFLYLKLAVRASKEVSTVVVTPLITFGFGLASAVASRVPFTQVTELEDKRNRFATTLRLLGGKSKVSREMSAAVLQIIKDGMAPHKDKGESK